ncbi:MAG TPA: arsenate reductase ArsC [Kiloniellales bacterium]
MPDKTSPGKVYNVLFLCTSNSARSIMAEAILDREGRPRFRAFSAGSHPAGRINPYALDLLKQVNHPTAALHCKSWELFAEPGAPKMDFVFTLCDKAAGEVCPAWPGQPMSAHWPFEDPSDFAGPEAEKRALFARVYGYIANRISIFISLPIASLDRLSLQKRLDEIGTRQPEPA